MSKPSSKPFPMRPAQARIPVAKMEAMRDQSTVRIGNPRLRFTISGCLRWLDARGCFGKGVESYKFHYSKDDSELLVYLRPTHQKGECV